VKAHQSRGMERLVSAIARYHPPFREHIQGCTPEELKRLEALVGGPLPAPHADFLQVMGRGMGGLSLYGADFRIGTLLDHYARHGPPAAPEEELVIGLARYGPYSGEYVDDEVEFQFDEDVGEYVVVANPPWEREHEFPEAVRILELIQTTLQELLFAKAFLQYQWPRFEHRQTLFVAPETPGALKVAGEGLSRLEFALHPESGSVRYFERATAVVIVSPNPGEPVRLSVGAQDATELRRLTDALSAQLPLTHAPG
jgi:hypothetical protein